jgi:hypothetical protein
MVSKKRRADPTAYEINQWLDSVEPDPADARDATNFRWIRAAVNAADEAELRAAVVAARAAGASWALIGLALGTGRQNAYRRFGR